MLAWCCLHPCEPDIEFQRSKKINLSPKGLIVQRDDGWLGRIVLIPAWPQTPCDLGQVIWLLWASVSSYLKKGRVWCGQWFRPALICYNFYLIHSRVPIADLRVSLCTSLSSGTVLWTLYWLDLAGLSAYLLNSGSLLAMPESPPCAMVRKYWPYFKSVSRVHLICFPPFRITVLHYLVSNVIKTTVLGILCGFFPLGVWWGSKVISGRNPDPVILPWPKVNVLNQKFQVQNCQAVNNCVIKLFSLLSIATKHF